MPDLKDLKARDDSVQLTKEAADLSAMTMLCSKLHRLVLSFIKFGTCQA